MLAIFFLVYQYLSLYFMTEPAAERGFSCMGALMDFQIFRLSKRLIKRKINYLIKNILKWNYV